MSREDREKYGELRVLEYSFNLEGDGRGFELIGINDADAAIIEHESDNPPMMFDDHDDAWRTWVDFHEQFNAPYSQEEMEMLDVLKIRYDRETGRDDD